MEIIQTGKTIDEAVEKACQELGINREEDSFEIEIIDMPKKSLFGLRVTPAKVKITVPDKPKSKVEPAVDYLSSILRGIGLENFEVNVEEGEENAVISFEGEGLGVIIGRRGETLDALQYLAGLVINRDGEPYYRIMVDSAGYRKKREKTLIELARKISASVLKTGRSITLEPMNPYERRIIHAAVATNEGVTSKSVGEEPFRRVTIASTNPKPARSRGGKSGEGNGNGRRRGGRGRGGRSGSGERQEGQQTERTEQSRERSDEPRSERREGDRNRRNRGERGGNRRHEDRGHTSGAVTSVESDAAMFEQYAATHPTPMPSSAPKAEPQPKAPAKSVDAELDSMPLYGKIEL